MSTSSVFPRAGLGFRIDEVARLVTRIGQYIIPAHEHPDGLDWPANVEEGGILDFIITGAAKIFMA